jgi:hypothetical protein
MRLRAIYFYSESGLYMRPVVVEIAKTHIHELGKKANFKEMFLVWFQAAAVYTWFDLSKVRPR